MNNSAKRSGKFSKLCFPAVMGILNLTPDSFYDGGKFTENDAYLLQVDKMIKDGASIIDIGASSTRPGSVQPDEEEELHRLEKPLLKIRKNFPEIILSVDTYHSSIAKAVHHMGADMINDISGGTFDKKMFSTIASLQIPYVLMHLKGNPAIMQKEPFYYDVITELVEYFSKQLSLLSEAGHSAFTAIDPGFGFGKTITHNYQILKNLDQFKQFNIPVVVGLSRKSMIYKVLKTTPATSLTGTTALHTVALLNHADILRVHDVQEAVETIRIIETYRVETD